MHISLDGRIILVKQVLSTMVVYQMLVLEMPVWLRKQIDKLRRGFLCKGKEFAIGGKWLVSWKVVCRPTCFGGLGILDLAAQSTALRLRWMWMQWTDPDKAWSGLPLPSDAKILNLFTASARFHLGNGQRIRFWLDPWMDGLAHCHRFPELFSFCTRKKLSVAQALDDSRWTRYLRTTISPQAIRDFTRLWVLMHVVILGDQSGTVS